MRNRGFSSQSVPYSFLSLPRRASAVLSYCNFFSSVTFVIFLNFGHGGQVFMGMREICGMPYVLDLNVVFDQALERGGRRENSRGEENRLGLSGQE